MTFTKTSQKFGQWADSRANTVYGLGFASEQHLTQVGLRGTWWEQQDCTWVFLLDTRGEGDPGQVLGLHFPAAELDKPEAPSQFIPWFTSQLCRPPAPISTHPALLWVPGMGWVLSHTW